VSDVTAHVKDERRDPQQVKDAEQEGDVVDAGDALFGDHGVVLVLRLTHVEEQGLADSDASLAAVVRNLGGEST
jgi:hypothetical protein